MFFLVSNGFRIAPLPWIPVLPSAFDGEIMNTDLSQGKRGLEIPGCCSMVLCDFLDDFTARSWRNFGRMATPVTKFGQYGFDCGLVDLFWSCHDVLVEPVCWQLLSDVIQINIGQGWPKLGLVVNQSTQIADSNYPSNWVN
jgi:hypothetical protein